MLDKKLVRLLTEYVDTDPETITEDTDIRADLGLDSLQLMSLAVQLESEYGVTISDRDAANIQTVGDVMKLLGE